MPIFKVLVPTEDTVKKTYGIEHEGSFWIVPGWFIQQSTQRKNQPEWFVLTTFVE